MQAWQRHMHTGWPGRQQAAVGALHNLVVEDAHEQACGTGSQRSVTGVSVIQTKIFSSRTYLK